MKNTRLTQLNTHRDAWVEINLDSVAHNVKQFRDSVNKLSTDKECLFKTQFLQKLKEADFI